MTNIRNRIILSGILQGIGCRPTMHRLATSLGLAGWVINTSDAVTIEIEGPEKSCKIFLDRLPEVIPNPGRIDEMLVSSILPLGDQDFLIKESAHGGRKSPPIPPDVSICPECVKELFDSNNRRFLYPFTTCAICGPRFTVVRSFPYDRERTSMADFKMCHGCLGEYDNPSDRRFHSQTNSCGKCGPRLSLLRTDGSEEDGDPILNMIELLGQGKILAIKGIGGFHLACDALNEDAVKLLRSRKGRAEKPFAVMMSDVEDVTRYCVVTPAEKLALESMASPIVLLDAQGARLADSVAPGMKTLGVMLPYSPIHHILFKHPSFDRKDLPRVLVMTSGNMSEEPICKDNEEAISRLGDLADAFLVHDREIVLRAEDSIVRIIDDIPVIFRRSRGFVPGALELYPNQRGTTPCNFPENPKIDCGKADGLLGTGGDLKNAPAILTGNRIVPGPHVGDLASPIAQDYFTKAVSVLEDYLEAQTGFVAFDPHPEYFSSHLARRTDVVSWPVYHHHAHAVSLLVEKGVTEPTLFAVFDGTGYGTDGTIWGGEFLLADRRSFRRVARFSLFPLPGAEAAIREPARILACLLWLTYGAELPSVLQSLFGNNSDNAWLWIEAFRKGINSPLTSSAGRLFDAAAALAGFRRKITFESQAAMWFEGIALREESVKYDIKIVDADLIEIDSAHLIRQMTEDALCGVSAPVMSARFHNSMAFIVAEVLQMVAERTGVNTVGLTGGCFQNRFLTEKSVNNLKDRGLDPLTHENTPPNDGGIAIGQVASVFETLYCVDDNEPRD